MFYFWLAGGLVYILFWRGSSFLSHAAQGSRKDFGPQLSLPLASGGPPSSHFHSPVREKNIISRGRLVVRSKGDLVYGGPGPEPTCHKCLIRDITELEVSPALLEPEEGKGAFPDQMGSMSWPERG